MFLDDASRAALFDAAPEPYLVLDRRLHIAAANRAYLRSTGRELRDIVDRWAWDAFPTDPDTEAQAVASFRRVFASGAPDTMALLRFDIPTPDGGFERRYWSLTHSPVFGPNGEVAFAIQHALDVTELERLKEDAAGDAGAPALTRERTGVIERARRAHEANLALRAESERLRALFEKAPGFKCVLRGPEHRFEFANEAYRALVGGRDTAGLLVREALPEVAGQGFFELLDRVYASGERHVARRVAVRLRGADGALRERVLDFTYEPMRDADGAVAGVFVDGQDVTEGVRAEGALRALNERLEERVAARTRERDLFATLFETTDVLVAALDLDYRILAGNRAFDDAFARASGVRPQAGDDVLALLADRPAEREAVRACWARALAGEEYTFVHAFGDPGLVRATFEVKFRTLRNEAGERIGAYQFVTDVSERLRAEAELARTQDALRQSQKMEAIGQLTGGVAHDFNNLLTVIRSGADLLRRGDLSEERRRRYVQAIADTADRAAKLTGQLLAFSRRQPLRTEVFDAAERTRGMVDMLSTVVGARVPIEVAVEAGSEPCLAEADAGQFETALVNLCVNARDAMNGEGSLRIAVRSADRLPPGRGHAGVHGAFVAVSVADAGTGIAPEDLERIFEPFFTTKEVGKGTGLGLSQVYGFAKQSGGGVDVASAPGEGATFTLFLPRAAARPAAEGEAASGAPAARAAGGRVLVVEDNAAVGEFASQLLRDLGYRTVLATGAAEALARLEAERFDLVFSDVVMPGMSGVELAAKVAERWPDLPVVVTSGYSSELAADRDRGGRRRGLTLLRKPYSAEELARVLAAAEGRAAA